VIDSLLSYWLAFVDGYEDGLWPHEGGHTPEAKAPIYGGPMRPKAEALGYLDATAKATAKAKAKALWRFTHLSDDEAVAKMGHRFWGQTRVGIDCSTSRGKPHVRREAV